MKKMLTSLLLIAALIFTSVPIAPVANAASPALVTQAEALQWARNHADHRTAFDVDGIYGVQCSDFGTAYINWLISGSTALNKPYTTYNGYQYFDLNYPDGWVKIRNTPDFVPQPGDVLVWGTSWGGGAGHVAVADEGCTTSIIKCIEQSGTAKAPTRYNTYNSYNGFVGAVRPLWKNIPAPSKPNAKSDKAVYRQGETVTIRWDKCSNADWYDVNIYNTNTGELVYNRNSSNTDSNTTFISTTFGAGKYKAKVDAVNYYNGYQFGSGDWIYFTVGMYDITYNANGGTGAPGVQTKTYGTALTLSSTKPTRTGYTFQGWATSASATTAAYAAGASYTNDANVTLYAVWKADTYTNTITHWLWGFKNGEGNNNDKRAFNISKTYFTAAYNTTYVMDKSRAAKLPNGVEIGNMFGTSSIEGTWKNYAFGTSVTQKSPDIGFEYDYAPITYKITYDLAGGTNNSANPSTYNVLYGVSLKNPTRAGYSFAGWYNGSTKVTGINEGKNAVFANADALYAELAKRQTGDMKLTAKWIPDTYTVTYNANGGAGAPAAQTKTHDVALTLSSTVPTKAGYIFKGWATSADSTTVAYAAGASYTGNADITLYALWKEDFQRTIVMKKELTRAYVDGGVYLTTDYGNGIRAKAMSKTGGYVLPLRYIAEKFHMTVEYLGGGQTKITDADGNYLIVNRDSAVISKYYPDGTLKRNIENTIATFTEDGVTYVPLRAVSEALGLGVRYQSTSHGSYVVISTNQNIDSEIATVNTEIENAYALGL